MLSSLVTALKLPDLRKKIIWTLVLLGIFRIGNLVPVPGPWNPAVLDNLFGNNSNLFGFLDLMAGGALRRMSIFALTVNPYITASIIMQLLQIVIPKLQELAKEGTEGRKIINQYVRYATVVLAIIQGTAITIGLQANGAIQNPSLWDFVLIVLSLTAGSVLLLWLGEIMTERGIGNGVSMIIFGGIVARLIPSSIEVLGRMGDKGIAGISIFSIIGFLIIAVLIVAGVVFVTQGERKIPVQYAKRMVGRKMYGGGSTYLPMKVNQASVIPIIFASAVLSFPPTLAQFLPATHGLAKFLHLFDPGRFLYLTFYAILIFVFTYFYTAVSFNPVEVADNMKKYGGFIPGIRPGKSTAEYLDKVLGRITFAGAIFLTAISLMPYLIMYLPGFYGLPVYFGGTALLIAVGVAIDTMKQIESQLLMRQYEGFLK